MVRRFEKLLIWPLLFAAIVFCVGINWGLPSRAADRFLFGDRPVWSGEKIVQLLGPRDSISAGADVDPNPVNAYGPVTVNDTDAQRAEIVARYRLYSDQPDEMITFRALSTIAKTRGDPRLYQYGGLWVYPVGMLLKLGSILHLIDLRSTPAFYLDHPEAFARFYIVARLYVVAWGLIGVWAVFQLVVKLTGDRRIGMLAGFAFTMMPVVVNMAHEAKPHLPGAVLILLAVLSAVRYLETGSRNWILISGALCGAACGMVLTGAISFFLLPCAAFLRWRLRNQIPRMRLGKAFAELCLASLAGLLVYFASNPFVLVHLLGNREVLSSNLQNSRAMYGALLQWGTILHAGTLICDGSTPLIAIGGAAAMLLLTSRSNPARSLLLAASVPMLLQFVLLATDKPAEYARFALFLDIALMLFLIHGIGRVVRESKKQIAATLVLCVVVAGWGAGYVWHFADDARARTSRTIVAERLDRIQQSGGKEIALYADPAPYCLPPVNLFDWKIVRLERGGSPPASADVFIRPVDEVEKRDVPMIGFDIQYWIRPRLLPTPISWAAKPFRVVVRRGLLEEEMRTTKVAKGAKEDAKN